VLTGESVKLWNKVEQEIIPKLKQKHGEKVKFEIVSSKNSDVVLKQN
jgi:hypothetical protein